MRLLQYFGEIRLENKSLPKEVIEGSRLVSEDNLETFSESAAYIQLDGVKLLKMDETSKIEIKQVGSHLDVFIEKGSLYFQVTKQLSDQESLEFHTGNVITGVRGTSGVVSFHDNQTQVVVFSGSVEINMEDEIENISSGEVGIGNTYSDDSTKFSVIQQEKNPMFHFNESFLRDFEENTIPSQFDHWFFEYKAHLEELESFYTKLSQNSSSISKNEENYLNFIDFSSTTYCLYDIDKDGVPELFLKFRYPLGDISNSLENPVEVETSFIYIYGLFPEENHSVYGGMEWKIKSNLSESVYHWGLSIPENGIGLQRQHWANQDPTVAEDFYITGVLTKEKDGFLWSAYDEMETVEYEENLQIKSNQWTNFEDISGMYWIH